MLPSFVFGIIYSFSYKAILDHKVIMFAVATILYLFSFIFLYYPIRIGVDVSDRQFLMCNFIKLSTGLSGALVMFVLFSSFNKTTRIIAFIGTSTLTFYTMNCIFSDTARYILRMLSIGDLGVFWNYSWTVVLCTVQIPIFMIATKIIRSNKWARLFLIGGR